MERFFVGNIFFFLVFSLVYLGLRSKKEEDINLMKKCTDCGSPFGLLEKKGSCGDCGMVLCGNCYKFEVIFLDSRGFIRLFE